MSEEDKSAHCVSKIVIHKKVLIPDYRGFSVQKGFFLLLWLLLQRGSKDPHSFLHEGRGVVVVVQFVMKIIKRIYKSYKELYNP